MKLADVILRLPSGAVLYHARAQAVGFHQAMREAHAVRAHGVATPIAVVAQLLIVQVCNSLALDRHRGCRAHSDEQQRFPGSL